jgi:WD40 repeat protein
MASGCRDKKVRVFTTSLQTMDPIVQFSTLRDSVHSVRFFNDDKEILVAYSDTPGLSVLDVRTGTWRNPFYSASFALPYLENFFCTSYLWFGNISK